MPIHITSHDVLIVTDVQNDFCERGALAVPDGDSIIEPIHKIAHLFEHVVQTQDWHPAHHSSFASSHPGTKPFDEIEVGYGPQTLWPDHCIQGSMGANFHPALRLPKTELILRKGFRSSIDSYSAFFENDHTTQTGLTSYLKERELTRVFLVGLAYDFCVGYSALDARRVGLPAVIIRDACRAIDTHGSLETMEKRFVDAGVDVVNSADLSN